MVGEEDLSKRGTESHFEIALFFLISVLGASFVYLFFFTVYSAVAIFAGVVFVIITGVGLFVVIVAKMWQHEVHTIMSGMQPDSTVSTRR
ncbi:MAG: hypothetical protein COU33_01120 [Candidatus Magasanikbacteria bacterium CG10_big_fil_rev_8_21_14_0_10_43_6]|uniref:Uncharacterized protein n=1 Tax=Candidatus Magasanikbacteria bacterium CG10_big_fil_rev_8_21_14_0_10_43_6 TaxID=1974650 RepID=A0A2M6W1X3_9BACT|nr:MAG: hypothetical protein COU33_01120 [Candidatus Magasanikbacteria bacterium CG10_big_fil_rev_8_21_14_0_10_43_6]